MKRLFFIALMIAIGARAWSAYLRNVPLQLSQPDGKRIEAYTTGDEYYRWVHDKDNYTIIQNESGWYVYARSEAEEIIPSNLIVGIDSPQSLKPGLNHSSSWLSERYRRIQSFRGESHSKAPSTGTINNLVIFIKFAGETDLEMQFSALNNMFNAVGAAELSLKQYYLDTSYNQVTINSHFFPVPQGELILSYTDPNPRAYFQPYSSNNPIGYQPDGQEYLARERLLLIRAITAINPLIPPGLNVDADSNGYVDNLCFVIKGNTDAWADLLWPHQYTLYDSGLTINGAVPSEYDFQLEQFLVAEYGGSSVLAHEMFHSMGAPDLYRYENTSITPIGSWDIMADDLVPPQQTGAWMKYHYGHWITAPQVIINSGTYSLSPLAISATNNSYRINSWNSGEYYILEYRKSCGYLDTLIPGTGLLVYRLQINQEGNSHGPPDELYIYRPHSCNNTTQGSLNSAALSSQSGFTMINESTVPSGFSANNTPGGLNLYEVGLAGDTITFKVKISDIQLTSPTGDDTWVSGSDKIIRWKSKNGQGNVKLEFSSNLGQSWLPLVESTPNSGSWLWENLPDLDSDQCLIKVSLLTTYHTDTCTYPFSIVSSLAIPEPFYPQDQASGVATDPWLRWFKVPGATTYILQVSRQIDFGTCVVNNSAISDSCFHATGLDPFTTFYWRIASSSDGVNSQFSPIRSFNTGEVTELPATPDLISPANNAVHQSLTPLLNWSDASFATNYHIQLARDAYYTNVVYDTLSGGQNNWHVPALSTHTAYFWRVAALNGVGSSVFSSSWKFTTGDGSSIEDQSEMQLPNYLAQNYPNPFNPVTRISFTVQNPNIPLSLRIYNLKGQIIKELFNGLPGSQQMVFEWDSRNEQGLPTASGIYLCKLQSGQFTQIRKMLLLK